MEIHPDINTDIDHIKKYDVDEIIRERKQDVEAQLETNPNISTKMSEFDVRKFNIDFDVEKALQQKLQKEKEKKKLAELNKEPPKKKIYQLSVGEILIGIKDSWFDILDDILQGKIGISLFTKNNRLFFIGLTICIIVLVVYLYDVLTEDEVSETAMGSGNVKEVHHIYHVVKSNEQLPSFLNENKQSLISETKSLLSPKI